MSLDLGSEITVTSGHSPTLTKLNAELGNVQIPELPSVQGSHPTRWA